MDHLENFAKTGLRTLCIAWTEVDPTFYSKWAENFHKASTALVDREAKLETVANAIEQIFYRQWKRRILKHLDVVQRINLESESSSAEY
ncbi:unnamed protein product [Trichobilharzia regenti]|nr:unnamed protein product [Trichobilharzia regenti]